MVYTYKVDHIPSVKPVQIDKKKMDGVILVLRGNQKSVLKFNLGLPKPNLEADPPPPSVPTDDDDNSGAQTRLLSRKGRG